jgi:hypothetical protein
MSLRSINDHRGMRGKEKDACILMDSKREHDLWLTWMLGSHQLYLRGRKRKINISWQNTLRPA